MRLALLRIFRALLRHFGPQDWWPARDPFEVCVGAVLTQAVAWTNVEKALVNLAREGLLSPEALAAAPLEQVAACVRPAGYFRAKAAKLKALATFVRDAAGGDVVALFRDVLPADLEAARSRLLSVYGIGPETADSLLLYAGGRPSFVVDAYTRRIFARLGFCRETDRYDDVRRLFQEHLPPDPAFFNEYHALIVVLGKRVCTKRAPACPVCPLRRRCPARVA
ncbi:MAG: endonuclease III domain-containing protein [Clostridia bacterium]|nr:endonuclease III domain-containing protein [Clostridia bacterium]